MKSYKDFLSNLTEADVMARADYKVGPSGRKSHKEIVFHDGTGTEKEDDKEVKKEEVELEEAKDTVVKDKSGKVISWKHEGDWKKTGEKKDPRGKVTHMSDVARRQTEKMTKEEMEFNESAEHYNSGYSASKSGKSRQDNPYKEGSLAAKYWARGYEHHKTGKQPEKFTEDVELDEAFINGREYASQGVMHPDHAKLHKAGDTRDFYAHGSGDKLSGKVTKNDGKEVHIQADKNSGGKLHKFKVTPHLPKPISEELEFDILEEAVESGNKGYGYHGQHDSDKADAAYSKAHATVKKVAGAAGHLRDAKKPNVMVKHYLDSRHGRHLADVGTHDHEYIKKDFGKFKKSYKESDFAKEETDSKLSYKEFLAKLDEQLLEYTPGPGGVTRVQGRSYGAQYHDPEGDDDADEKPKAKPADAPKRGRGRPAGAKSGANQKVTSGKSYGGIATHSLHLPNTNR